MFDKFFVGRDVLSSSNNGKYKPISRVTLLLDDANSVTAGDDTGYEIVSNCPNATQEIANDLLAYLKGHEYQAYTADGANLDPSAELGDGITVDGLYSVISRVQDNGSGYSSISAPGEAEWEGDFPMDGPLTQMFNREIKRVGASITKTAEEIRLEVIRLEQSVDGKLTEELKKYATLKLTEDSIAAAVESSQTYTDGKIAEKLESYATVKLTEDSIAAAVESSQTYTDGKIAEKLESYATVELTNQSIEASVQSSKDYTDGQLTEKLKDYATVELTNQSIEASVQTSKEYTDGQLTEKLKDYATLELTEESIEASVQSSKDYTDGQLTEKLKDYATLELTNQSIEASVQSSKDYTDGQLTEKLKDYATVELTNQSIEASVQSSKDYTDGQLTEKLKDYATLELTTDSIEASVQTSKEYTDGQLTEKLKDYATLELTTESIEASVQTSKEYTDGQLTEKLKDYATLELTEESIEASVQSSKDYTDGQLTEKLKDYATLELTTESIEASVQSSKDYTDGQLTEKLKDYATLELTTESIEASVQSSKDYTDGQLTEKLKDYATLELTTDSIEAAVESSQNYTNGAIATQLREYSTTAQTAVAISWEVGQLGQSIDGKLQNYSTQTQTATAIASAVNGLVDGAYVTNSITTALDGIALSASSKDGSTTLTLKSGLTELNTTKLDLTVKAANITGTLTIGQLPLDIATTGDIPTSLSELTNDSKFVTERGVTTIVDGYVTTDYLRTVGIKAESIVSGTIYADRNIVLDGLMKIVNGPYSGYLGVNYGKGGAVICNSGMDVFVIANDDAAKLSYKEEKRIWVHNSGCYSSETMKIYSDRTLKDAISYDLTAEEKLFPRLRPCSFVYQNDQDQKRHWGFIAQEFIESAEEVALDTDSLAVVGQCDGKYSLGYGEITALNTYMIQLLLRRVEALEKK